MPQSSLATAGHFTATFPTQINADLAIILPNVVHAQSDITFQSGETAPLTSARWYNSQTR